MPYDVPGFVAAWKCSECNAITGSADELRLHIWATHGADILKANPYLLDAMTLMADRQARLRAEVFGTIARS
jgi:hypothetical protein